MTFDEFIHKNKKSLFNKIDSCGQVLGKMPSSSNEFIRTFDNDWISDNWDLEWRTTDRL